MYDCVTGQQIEKNFGCIMADEMVGIVVTYNYFLFFKISACIHAGNKKLNFSVLLIVFLCNEDFFGKFNDFSLVSTVIIWFSVFI